VRAPDSELSLPSAADVLAYWPALGPKRWFAKSAAVDDEISEKFQNLYVAALAGSLARWENEASGALALVIVRPVPAQRAPRQRRRLRSRSSRALWPAARSSAASTGRPPGRSGRSSIWRSTDRK